MMVEETKAPDTLQGPASAEPKPLEEILRALSNGSTISPTSKDNGGGESIQLASLKDLIVGIQQKLAPPSARRAQGPAPLAQGLRHDNCVFLKVTLVEGRALVGELADERTTSSAVQSFAVDLQFNGQRARTRNEVRCCVEPNFGNEAFVFVLRQAHELPSTAGGWASFLQTDLPLHVVLTKQKVARAAQPAPPTTDATLDDWSLTAAAKRELVGTAEVDWRRALVPSSGAQEDLHQSGGVFLAVELASAAPDSIVHPVGGILQLRLEVVAPPGQSSFPFAAADVTRIMELQVSVRSEARRDFYLYADAWWKDYTSVSKELHTRSVKIFAEDERGQHRCVCSFLQPYRQGRLLPTPRHAARFVSLLPFQRRPSVGDQRVQAWNSPHAFLATGRGDSSDHALLLCSLLLGFGLDAFVCVGRVHNLGSEETEWDDGASAYGEEGSRLQRGRDEETGHMWVCTFSGPRAEKKAYFWESLTGQRFSMFALRAPKDRKRGGKAGMLAVDPHHFSKVSCMFNHREFFANKQRDNKVGTTSLDIADPSLWKPMASGRITPTGMALPQQAGSAGVVLLRPGVHAETVAEGLEGELKQRMGEWRENKGLSTVWDGELGYLLGPAMFAYEQERVSGFSFGSGDFQDAVQGAVPDRHSFKGYPTCFDHCSCGKIMACLLANVVSRDILGSAGDHLRFALRAMVFPYPDGVLAVWLMLACRFEAPKAV